MPRKAAKVDDNQSEIVDFFRGCYCSVAITSAVGDGFTDIVVGQGGVSTLVEIKDGKKPPSKQKLTPDQVKFHSEWRGSIFTVSTIQQAQTVMIWMQQCAKAIRKSGVERP